MNKTKKTNNVKKSLRFTKRKNNRKSKKNYKLKINMRGGAFSEPNFKTAPFNIPKQSYPLRLEQLDDYRSKLRGLGASLDEIKIFEQLLKVTTHVSFDDLIRSIKVTLRKFEAVNRGREFALFIPTILDKDIEEKSNYWISKIFYLLMIHGKPSHIYTEYNELELSEIADVIICDDAMYSGTQMSENLVNIDRMLSQERKERVAFHILCSFISEEAIQKINTVRTLKKELYYDRVMMPLSFYTENDVGFKIPSVNANTLAAATFSPYPIYFDHKIADLMSSLPDFYEIGNVRIKDTENLKGGYKQVYLNSLLYNCEYIDLKDPLVYDNRYSEKCPPVPYRKTTSADDVTLISVKDFLDKYKYKS